MKKYRNLVLLSAIILLLFSVVCVSLAVGKFPITIEGLISGNEMIRRVFLTLRLPRTMVAVIGGFALGIAGSVFQTVFHNPLAAPDMIGVSSGASAGAAFAILFASGTVFSVGLASFIGGLAAVIVTLLLSGAVKNGGKASIVLAGIAVHSLCQTALMFLKTAADPERELASIEYWIMGALNGVSLKNSYVNMIICVVSVLPIFLLSRQIIMLSNSEDEAKMLGVSVNKMRFAVLIFATLAVTSTVSVTGIISFVGLLAPHAAALMTKKVDSFTLLLSGLCGSILLTVADVFSRSLASSELPVSIFTSLIGAPFLVWLLWRERRRA